MNQESDLAGALKLLIEQQQKRLNEISDREADLFRREQAMTAREERNKAGMKRLNDLVENHFRAPAK